MLYLLYDGDKNDKNIQSNKSTQQKNQSETQPDTISSTLSKFMVSIDSSEMYHTPPQIQEDDNQQATTSSLSTLSEFMVSIDSSEMYHTPPQILEDDNQQALTSNLSNGIKATTKEPDISELNQSISSESVEETDKNKIAAFDLDGTLITPKSKNKFSKDINDWKMLDGSLKTKIKRFVDAGYAFVIFSNQMGVSSKFVTLNQIKLKFKNIIQSLDIPCVALLCTHLDKHRKPAIGMFELYKTVNCTELDLKNSFFVGDAMGRQKDHSAADLLFAYNCKLPFIPIESFLSGLEKPKLYTYDLLKRLRIPKFPHLNRIPPPRIVAKGGLGSNETTEFCFIEEETIRAIETFVDTKCKSVVILLIGLFGSGKSFFFEKYLAPHNYKSITYNVTRSPQEELEQFNNFVQNDDILNKRIVIDQPNLTVKQRKRWIDLAKKEGYEVFAFHLNVSVEQCAHLVRFRSFYIETDRKAPTQNEEGFRTIYLLDFFENFEDQTLKDNRKYYYQYLYDKP